jgi:hypothetical protein
MRLAFVAAGLAIGTLVGAAAAQAASYNLGTDLSGANSPGSSPWTVTFNGGTTLPTVAGVGSNGNALEPAIVGPFFGTGGNLNADVPFVFTAATNGSGAGLTDNDFLIGDVIIHTPNSGTDVTITWTAPTDGILDNLDFAAWYAHSSVVRSNDVSLAIDGDPASPHSWVTSTVLNSNRLGAAGLTGGGLSLNAGDLITLSLAKTALQSFGSLTGVNLSFDFQAAVTPVPPALPLFVSALAGLGWFAHRRRRGQAA